LEVKLTLHGILRDYLPRKVKGKTTLDLPNDTTIDDIVRQLKIKQNVSAAVNGVEVETSHMLQDDEELHLFRFIAGG
jgi:sulfur carrier protein ThiS